MGLSEGQTALNTIPYLIVISEKAATHLEDSPQFVRTEERRIDGQARSQLVAVYVR